MKPTTRTKTNRASTTEQIDVFLGFQLRMQTLEFLSAEVRRLQASGEEIMAELAALRPSGDLLRDARVRAGWEEKLEEIFELFGSALDRLGWEMDQ